MTGSISRKLCQRILFLYPKPFRDEFGKEMLDVWKECERTQGSWRLLADVLVSSVRQQIHYFSIRQRKYTALYSEVGVSPSVARMMAGAALIGLIIASVLAPVQGNDPQQWTGRYTETVFLFPIVPEARSCSGISEHASEPERILTTGVLVRETANGRQYRTIVRGKVRLWISTVPWGWYCLNPSNSDEELKRIG